MKNGQVIVALGVTNKKHLMPMADDYETNLILTRIQKCFILRTTKVGNHVAQIHLVPIQLNKDN